MAESATPSHVPQSADDLDAPASEVESWLAEAAAAPAVPFGPPADALSPGVRVDEHYEIEGVLGAGGMAVVYRALDLSLDRSVALKLHRWADDRSRDRLLREAKVMAKLSHPNVLAVHEVGTWRDHVYLAAELVEGKTARQWRRSGRSWQDIVQLYIAAGEGLAAAHRIGLVHRDFKPDNVLVGEDGRVRVADFGLARPAGPVDANASEVTASSSQVSASLSGLSNLTRTGATVGTPAYMAPEQFMAEELDGRADQFAFCVSLFEALHGRRPFAGRTTAALAAAIGRGPQRAGQVRLPRRLRRAVDRGLRPNPADRFGSMEDLLAELRTSTRPRRPLAWGAAGLGLGLGAVAWAQTGGDACEATASDIDGSWNDDRRARLGALFDSDPRGASTEWPALRRRIDQYTQAWSLARVGACRDATKASQQLSDRALACLADSRRELDALLGALEETTPGKRRRALGAVDVLVQPAECRDPSFLLAAFPPPANAEVRAEVESLREQVAKLRRSAWAGRDKETLRADVEALAPEITAVDYGPLHAEYAYLEGTAARFAGEPAAAQPLLEDAYFLAREAGHHRVSANAAKDLARLVGFAMGRTEPGLLWARHAVTEAKQGGVPLGQLVSAEHNLGILQDTAGHWDEAEGLYRGALSRLPPGSSDHALRRAEILVSIAALEGGRGHVDEAIEAAEEALTGFESIYGGDHPSMIPAIGNIGYALGEAGRYEEAYGWHDRALKITEATYGEDQPGATVALINLAVAAQGMGDIEAAKRHYADVERISLAHFGPEHPDLALVAQNLAGIAEDEGDHRTAATLRAKAVRVFEATHGPAAADTLSARVQLANSQLRSDDVGSACATMDEVATLTSAEQGESRVLAQARLGQGVCLLRHDEPEAAVETLRDASRIAEQSAYAPTGRAGVLQTLAEALVATEPPRTAEARRVAGRAKTLYADAGDTEAAATVQRWLDAL